MLTLRLLRGPGGARALFRSRIARERRVVREMVAWYCRQRHGGAELCPRCAGLLRYTVGRLARCPHADGKSSCPRCEVYCFAPTRQAELMQVMLAARRRMAHWRVLLWALKQWDRLASICHQRRREACESEAASGTSDRRPTEAYLRYVEGGWREKAAKLRSYRAPQ